MNLNTSFAQKRGAASHEAHSQASISLLTAGSIHQPPNRCNGFNKPYRYTNALQECPKGVLM